MDKVLRAIQVYKDNQNGKQDIPDNVCVIRPQAEQK